MQGLSPDFSRACPAGLFLLMAGLLRPVPIQAGLLRAAFRRACLVQALLSLGLLSWLFLLSCSPQGLFWSGLLSSGPVLFRAALLRAALLRACPLRAALPQVCPVQGCSPQVLSCSGCSPQGLSCSGLFSSSELLSSGPVLFKTSLRRAVSFYIQ